MLLSKLFGVKLGHTQMKKSSTGEGKGRHFVTPSKAVILRWYCPYYSTRLSVSVATNLKLFRLMR